VLSLFQEVMEEGSSLQCLLWADHRVDPFLDRWVSKREDAHALFKQIADRRTQFLKNNPYFSARIFRFILSYSVPHNGDVDSVLMRSVVEAKSRILKTLGVMSYSRPWQAEDLLTTVGGIINFDMSAELKTRNWNQFETLANQVPSGGRIAIAEDGLTWKGDTDVSFKGYRVVDYPQYWSLASMQQLIGDVFRDAYRINSPFFLHYGVHCPKQSKASASFSRRSQLIENQGKSQMLLRLIPDLANELDESDHVRRAMNEGARLVWTQLGAGLWGEGDRFRASQESIKSLFRINQFNLTETTCLHLPFLLACLPMSWSDYIHDLRHLNAVKTTVSYECSNFVPIQGEWMGTASPGMLLLGRRGQILNWNPFDNKTGNYNVVVVGRSGSGKSVFMQDLLLSGLGTGSRVFVLEIGRSFEKMNALLEGQHIEFSLDSKLCLNPFSSISIDNEDERLCSFSMIKSVISCMASPLDGTSDYENALIEKAINHAYNTKGRKATITTVAEWLLDHEDDRAKTLGTMLTPFSAGGTYAKYFEGENNIDFTSSMVLIELEELKEQRDLQTVVLQLFIMSITNLAFMGDRKTPFYICIDEAWDLFKSKQTQAFIETLARRLRKYHGSLVIGTQSVEDFFSAPGALAAFENSDWMCFLSQKKSSISRLSESGRLDLDESMRAILESITTRHGEFSEVMICDGDGNYSVARLILDRFSELLYSSNPEEYATIKDLQRRGVSTLEAIEQMIAQEERNNKDG